MGDFTGFHEQLRDVAREVLRRYRAVSVGDAPPSPVDWRLLADSGWLGLEVPEHLGGAGATLSEVAVVLEEMGRAACLSSYLGGAVLGVGLLNMVEPGPERDDLLSRVAAGRARPAVALATGDEGGDRLAPFAFAWSGGRLEVSGRADFVPDAPDADCVLLVAADPAGGLAVIPTAPGAAGLSVAGLEVLDPSRRFGRVEARGLSVGEDAVWRLTTPGHAAGRELFDRGAVAVACDSLGLAEEMLRATVAYALVRHQFGRPIGSFQAVKHACADMLVRLRVGRELLSEAVGALGEGAPGSSVQVAQAKSYVGEAAVDVAGRAMQLHGGIGYTWESGIHVYLKRAALNRSLFGSPAWHRRRLAARYG